MSDCVIVLIERDGDFIFDMSDCFTALIKRDERLFTVVTIMKILLEQVKLSDEKNIAAAFVVLERE